MPTLTSSSRGSNKIPTEVDIRAEAALRHVLKPQFHSLAKEWVATATDAEKHGMIRLSMESEPTLYRRIGRPSRPRPDFQETGDPTMPADNPNFSMTRSMQMSGSMPFLSGPPPSVMEDPAEIAQVSKPGGYVVKLTDSAQMQNMKNKQRNTGTFSLFGGSGEYMTSSKSQFNLRSVGQEYLYPKIKGMREL